MVDKKILREMSQDVLVIPFTEEMAEKLDKFCRIQIENIEQNKVEKLIMSFLTRKNDKELEMAFNKYVTENEQTNNILPVAILPVLAEYIVLLAIDGCEETKRKALYTLMLKNALLIAVKGDGFVAHPKAVADIFDYYYDYLRDEKVFGKGEENNDVPHTIKKLLGERGNETIQLGIIKEELKEFIEGEKISYGLTSVLLRLINDDDDRFDLPNTTEFKVNELTVYLFYEFLAEAMGSEIDNIAK